MAERAGAAERYVREWLRNQAAGGYQANLVSDWIPALDGVQAMLERGAKEADIGCGHGASTIILASAFPASEFYGFDYARHGRLRLDRDGKEKQ